MKYDEKKECYYLNDGSLLEGASPKKMVSCLLPNKPYNPFPQFTTEERKEVAEYMIELWKEWAK